MSKQLLSPRPSIKLLLARGTDMMTERILQHQARERLLQLVPTAVLAAHVLSLSVFGKGETVKDKPYYLAYLLGCPEAQSVMDKLKSITYTKTCPGKHGGTVTDEQRSLLQDLSDWGREGRLVRIYGTSVSDLMYPVRAKETT